MASLISFRGLQVPDTTPGAGGAAIKQNFDNLVTWSPKSKWDATGDPTPGDNSGDDYYPGSMWFNTTAKTLFLCRDSIGTAHWQLVISAASDADIVVDNVTLNVDGKFQAKQALSSSTFTQVVSFEVLDTTTSRHLFQIVPRKQDFLDVYLTDSSSGAGYARFFAERDSNTTGRIDFYYYDLFFQGTRMWISGNPSLARLGDATSMAQYGSAQLGFQPSFWTGSAADTFVVGLLDCLPNAGQTNKVRIRFITGPDGEYEGDHFSIQLKNPRTNTLSGSIGINNADPTAHLDLIEDDSTRVCVAIRGASEQSANLQEWRNSSNSVLSAMELDGSMDAVAIRADASSNYAKTAYHLMTAAVTTSNATATTGFSITFDSNTTAWITVRCVVGMNSTKYAYFERRYHILVTGGTMTITSVGTDISDTHGTSATVGTTNSGAVFTFQVTGQASTTAQWRMTYEWQESTASLP